MSLLQQYNKRERNVSFAKQLNITPKYLSSVVKEVSGKTAARWIDESVILEAKALLKYSGMSIQEIAYHLNFSAAEGQRKAIPPRAPGNRSAP